MALEKHGSKKRQPLYENFRLFVVSKCYDSVMVKEHHLAIKNYTKPKIKDLNNILEDIYPSMDRGKYSLYCRLEQNELIQVVDYLSMVVSFKAMERNPRAYLYLIHTDIKKWLDANPELREHPEKIRLTIEYADVKSEEIHDVVEKVSIGCQYDEEEVKSSSPIKSRQVKKKTRYSKTH